MLRKPFANKQAILTSRYTQCNQYNWRKNAYNSELQLNRSKNFCLLNLIRFSLKTRSWKCLIHFVMPLKLSNILSPAPKTNVPFTSLKPVLQIFSDFLTKDDSMLPSMQPSLLIIVFSKNQKQIHLNQLLNKKLQTENHPLNQIFISLELIKMQTSEYLEIHRLLIKTIKMYCLHCISFTKSFISQTHSLQQFSHLNKLETIENFPPENFMTQWDILGREDVSEFITEMMICETFPSRNRLRHLFKRKNVRSEVTRAHAFVWKTIMANYSYLNFKGQYCTNGKVYRKKLQASWSSSTSIAHMTTGENYF